MVTTTKRKMKTNKISFLDDLTYGEKHGRYYLTPSKKFTDFPDLLSTQRHGFNSFLKEYLLKLFEDVNPVYDIAGERLSLSVTDIKVGNPLEDVDTCKKKELTYGGIISGKMKLYDHEEEKTLFNKRINIGILPIMTKWGSYIVSGVERVIISQIIRSYGIFFNFDKKNYTQSFKIIPERGSWIQIFTEKSGRIVARVNNSRKFLITPLLRVFGFETDESIKAIFSEGFEEDEDFDYVQTTLEKDTVSTAEDAAVYIYNKMRPGEIIDVESAMDYIKSIFLSPDRMYLGKVARRKINAKLGIDKDIKDDASHIFDAEDLIASIKYLLALANKKRGYYYDDIDHLANRRVRSMGECLYAHLLPVMRKFIKSIKGKLSVLNLEEPIKMTSLANFKILDNSIKSFFATSQLSQFLDQVNPLAEIEHKRRITALGPGGLKRDTATFEVRDVHPSHYGRVCPVETPEGQNIGLVTYQALYSKLNEFGFMETAAMKVAKEVPAKKEYLVNKISDENIKDGKRILVKDGDYITEKAAQIIEKLYKKKGTIIKVRPFLTGEIEYLSPEYDEGYIIADISIPLDKYKNILQKRVPGRHFMDMEVFYVNDITHVDVNPTQIFSANTSTIPFVDHDDAVRAAMGTNMQRQAVPLIKPEAPFVGTGMEGDVAAMTYALVTAEEDGEILYVDGKRIKVKYQKMGIKEYELITFKRSNQKTTLHQRPKVSLGKKVNKGDVLIEGPSVVDGELALGKNLRVAFMQWEGYNYEDAIIVSQRLVQDDELTSITIKEYEIEVSDTKLGPEETTNDIPGISLAKLKDIDEDGIIRIGSTVKGGDILVGKISPKSEGELSPEEKLIHAIFGDKSKRFKDNSLYLPSGSHGKVIDIVVLDVKNGDSLSAGVRKKIKVYIASIRKIEVGDKLAGRHGNKGIIAIVVPEEDMPYTEDGQAIDICLNPLGVVSRMNVGQVYETQLGLVAKAFGKKFAVPLFSNFGPEQLTTLLTKAGFDKDGKFLLYDGRTGEVYRNKVSVGYMYIIKLVHMVEDKIHGRSVGPYSLITQQPLGGKAREGGQRFGEMEVWALEAYSAVYTLQEMLTVKSDDVQGRNKTYEAIIKGGKIKVSGLPESFNLVTYLFKGLGQNIVPLSEDEIVTIHQQRVDKIINLGLKGITSDEKVEEVEIGGTKNHLTEIEEKKQLMETVVEELKQHEE